MSPSCPGHPNSLEAIRIEAAGFFSGIGRNQDDGVSGLQQSARLSVDDTRIVPTMSHRRNNDAHRNYKRSTFGPDNRPRVSKTAGAADTTLSRSNTECT